MNRASLRRQLAILSHLNPSELVALDNTVKPAVVSEWTYLKGVDDISGWIEQREASRLSFYIGVADRKAGLSARAKTADIAGSSCIAFDIDPVREAGVMATPEQRDSAWTAAGLLTERLKREGYLSPHLACSGNGYYLFLPIPRVGYLDCPDFDRRVARFMGDLRGEINHLPVKLDHTQDWVRLIRVIGTENRKGEDSTLWQTSKWL